MPPNQPPCPPLQVRRIADLELAKTAARMADRGIGLEVSNSLMERITAEGEAEGGMVGGRAARRGLASPGGWCVELRWLPGLAVETDCCGRNANSAAAANFSSLAHPSTLIHLTLLPCPAQATTSRWVPASCAVP